jgi:hypothetical protein
MRSWVRAGRYMSDAPASRRARVGRICPWRRAGSTLPGCRSSVLYVRMRSLGVLWNQRGRACRTCTCIRAHRRRRGCGVAREMAGGRIPRVRSAARPKARTPSGWQVESDHGAGGPWMRGSGSMGYRSHGDSLASCWIRSPSGRKGRTASAARRSLAFESRRDDHRLLWRICAASSAS